MLHTASPVTIKEPTNPEEMIKPAVEGTLAVLRASRENKVQRVVVTSSIGAIGEQDSAKIPEGTLMDEEWWSDIDNEEVGAGTYVRSKTLAERAAW